MRCAVQRSAAPPRAEGCDAWHVRIPHCAETNNSASTGQQVYALEIQMCTETKNNKKLQQLYQKAVQVEESVV